MKKEFDSVVKEIMEATGKPTSVLDAPGADTMAKADVDKQATTPSNDPKAKEKSKKDLLNDKKTKVEEEEDESEDMEDGDEEEEDLDDYFTDDEEEEDGEGDHSEPDSDDEEEEDEDMDDEEEEDDDEMEDDEEEETFKVDEQLVADSISNLFDGADNLNEEFVNKAKTVTETYMRAAAKQIHEQVKAQLTEKFNKKLEKSVKNIQSDLVEKLDKYLDYVVEEWMAENELAVNTGIRTEIAEGFMNKLHQVFTESYIEVPESKIDLVEELTKRVEALKEHNQSAIKTSIKYKSLYEDAQKANIVKEVSDGLSDNKAAKLAKLAEDISYDNLEEFEDKVKTLKESISTKKTQKADDNFEYDKEEVIKEEVKVENDSTGDDEMDSIIETMTRLGKKSKR